MTRALFDGIRTTGTARGSVQGITRRSLIAGGAALAVGLGLTACSSATAGASSSSGTRTVDTAKGKIKVPANPKRIVVINPIPMSTLYDLGAPVIAVYDEGVQYVAPRYRARYEDAKKVGSNQVDVEKTAAAKPDLIVGADFSFNTSAYRQLSQIAPTVIVPVNGTWEQTAEATAAAIGNVAGLDALKSTLAQRQAALKKGYAAVLADYRWDLIQGGFDHGDFWLYGAGSDIGQIVTAAGVQLATASATVKGANSLSLSYEQISRLSDADVIGFYSDYDDKPNNLGPQLFAQAGFTSLAAATADRLVPIPDFLPAGYGDALAVLDEVEAGLKKLPKKGS
jgi:iron complex transport system substrate-binding protein